MPGSGDMSTAEFKHRFNRWLQTCGTCDREVAKLLQVSLPTVQRWAKGETAPHPIARSALIAKLEARR